MERNKKKGSECKKSKAYECGLSSRIKTIFIELHNYSFFHGPSEIRKIDRRFIGREGIINKLKSILTNNDTKSGAYLVTGYRGMGKSSFVSKVINEIDPSNQQPVFYIRIARILIFLLLLSFFNWDLSGFWNFGLWIVMITFFAIMLIILVRGDEDQNDLKSEGDLPKKIQKCMTRLHRFKKTFDLNINTEAENRSRVVAQSIYISLMIHMISMIVLLCFSVINSFLYWFISYSLLVIILWWSNTYFTFRRFKDKKKYKEYNYFKYLNRLVALRLKTLLNYSRRIYIRINLGYDDLKDIDILRLIARNIEKAYRDFGKFPRRTFFVFIMKLIFSFLLVAMIYYHGPVKNLNQVFKEKMKITEYFPSQKKDYKEVRNFKKNPEQFIPSNEPMKALCVYVDHFVLTLYDLMIETFGFDKESGVRMLHNDLIHGTDKKSGIALIKEMTTMDYFFWIYFIAIFFLIHSLIPRLFGRSPRWKILKKLKALNDLIDSQVTEEKGGTAGIKFDLLFNLFRKKVKAHARADIREIEKRLIDILDEFDRGNLFSIRPEFICIFDELDKIEPNINANLEQKKSENPDDLVQPETMYFATENIRHRLHTIFNILSNLKHFLNTAKAKFIFIAGREMYDASLAGVSDRNFFIGSIFHDVIYVNSFLTEDSHDKDSDLTSMTERYVCQFLFPSSDEVKEYSLKEYGKYLDEYFLIPDPDMKPWEYHIKRQKKEKIIFTLREFISYLTYRSNGAPKKLTTFFENYIHKPDIDPDTPGTSINSEFTLCVGFSSRKLYLKFDYYDQYTFGMVSYLVKPVVLSISRAIKEYGDKLLVSTSFLVDHLYKFHKNAFSWRNIELTPEIVDINKPPQLRELITLIINNLSSNHILEIVSGLYSFKFHKKISEEISFLSKISERESAAFNFTLDESLSLKRHHKRLLKELKTSYQGSSNSLQFVNAVSFIHMIIGDLHFYDEEYNDAIIHYMEAVQFLRNMSFSADNASFFVILIRNMLKLGFALEKRKSYVSAFMIYGFLVSKIVKFREIDLDTMGLREKKATKKGMKKYLKSRKNCEKFILKTGLGDLDKITTSMPEDLDSIDTEINLLVKDWDYRVEEIFSFGKKDCKKEILEKRNKEIQYDREIILEPFDYDKDKPACFSADFGDLLNQTPFTSLKEDLLYSISSFEGIRLIYQPLMAKLQMIEKVQLGGITLIDLRRIENEFNFITKTINIREKFMVAAEFWYKIGDILFFKNGLLPHNFYDRTKGNEDSYYCSHQDALCSCNEAVSRIVLDKGYHIPCRACVYYMRSLRVLCMELFDISPKFMKQHKIIPLIFAKLSSKSLLIRNSTALRVMANTLSGLGNSFLSCSTGETELGDNFLESFLNFTENPKDKKELSRFFYINGKIKNGKEKKFSKVEEVFIYYYMAYQFYLRTGENREAAVQMLKLLYLIRNLIVMEKTNEEIRKTKCTQIRESIKKNLHKIEKTILKSALMNLYRVYGSVHRLEIEDYKDIFDCVSKLGQKEKDGCPKGKNSKEKFSDSEIDLKKITLSADFKEYFVVYKEIRLRCCDFEFPTNPGEIINYCAATPYYSINKMYNRIIDLNFKVTVNYKIFEQLGLKDFFGESKKDEIGEDHAKNAKGGTSSKLHENLLNKTQERLKELNEEKRKIV